MKRCAVADSESLTHEYRYARRLFRASIFPIYSTFLRRDGWVPSWSGSSVPDACARFASNMQVHGVLLLCTRLFALIAYVRASCVPLRGIESNVTGSVDRSEGLSLEVIKGSMIHEAFDPLNPTVPTLATCSSGLETSISMRNLLGQYSTRAHNYTVAAD